MNDKFDPENAMKLTGKADAADTALRIKYKLENRSPLAVHVWDELPDFDKKGEFIHRSLAYVCWEDPKTARIARAFLQLPTDFAVGKKSEPYIRTIEPGKDIEGEIELSLPLSEYNPYYPRYERAQMVECENVRLLIGWIEHRDEMKVMPRASREEKAFVLRGSWRPPHQRLAELRFDVPVPLLRFATRFDRRLPLQ